jgi:transcriptional regulator with XRE-family HTH domain
MTKANGARIRAAREKRGWSQRELANEIGTTAQAVSLWENGEASPSSTNVFALARALRLDPESLVS